MDYILRVPMEVSMEVPVSEAKGRLTDLVRRAEAGEEIVLTRHGHAAVRLIPVSPKPDKVRRALLEELRSSAARKATDGAPAARSQDFLYDDEGLPA